MSRVYDIPRYKNQTLYKVRLHIESFFNKGLRENRDLTTAYKKKIFGAFFNNETSGSVPNREEFLYNFYMNADDDLAQEWDDCTEHYASYVREEAYMKVTKGSMDESEVLEAMSVAGELICQLIYKHCYHYDEPTRKVYCDSDAALRFHAYLINPKRIFSMTAAQSGTLEMARAYSVPLSMCSMYACNFGEPGMNALMDVHKIDIPSEYTSRKAVLYGMEGLRMRSMTPEMRTAYSDMRSGEIPISHRKMRYNNPDFY